MFLNIEYPWFHKSARSLSKDQLNELEILSPRKKQKQKDLQSQMKHWKELKHFSSEVVLNTSN